jgi:DNA-binding IclR family transcriptional regulator
VPSTREKAGEKSRRKILKAIASRKNYPFTVRELAVKTSLSSSATHHHLLRLRDDGLVSWQSDAKRTLGLTKAGYAHLAHLKDLPRSL